MKHSHKLLVIALFIIITFLSVTFFLPQKADDTVLKAFTRTAEAFYLVPASTFQTNALNVILEKKDLQQDVSISLQSCQSDNASFDFLDDLSSLRITLSSMMYSQQTEGSYALQYSAMPLLSGDYTYHHSEDTLDILSNELWDGIIEVPLTNFGDSYQNSDLQDFFPMFSLNDSFSLNPLSLYLKEKSIRQVDALSLKKALQTCKINILSEIPSYETLPIETMTDISDWSYYTISPSEELTSFFQQTFSQTITAPITVAIDSDGLIRLMDCTFQDKTNIFAFIPNPDEISCDITISHQHYLTPDIHAILSFACHNQCFTITTSDLTFKHVFTPLHKNTEFLFSCNASYSITPASSKPTPINTSKHYSVLSMNHDQLQTLENEIWTRISKNPQLSIFL